MPTSADLVLRDATPADIDAITRIVANGPDAAADWTFPGLRQRAEETRPLHVRAFTRVFKNRQNLLRVAEREGRVVGYCVWVKRQMVGEEVVAVDLTDGYDEQGRKFSFIPRIDNVCYRLPFHSFWTALPLSFVVAFMPSPSQRYQLSFGASQLTKPSQLSTSSPSV